MMICRDPHSTLFPYTTLFRSLNDSGEDVASAVERLAGKGIDVAAAANLLDGALIVPVLTAHPTEVMRKSMIDHRNRVAEDRKSTRLNSSHASISYAVFCSKKK